MTRGPLAPDDPRHGTWGGYNNYRCRCQPCREASRIKSLAWRRARGPLAPNDRRHGTWGGYINYRCRCQPCREANRLKGRAWHRAHGVLPRAERIAANAATLRPCGTMAAYSRHRRQRRGRVRGLPGGL